MDALGSITTGPGHVILCVAKTGYHTLILFTDADDQIVAKVEYAYPSPGYTIVPMGKKNKKRIWRMTRTPVVWRLDDRVYVPDEEEVATTFDLENVHAAILSSWDVAQAFDDRFHSAASGPSVRALGAIFRQQALFGLLASPHSEAPAWCLTAPP